MARRAVETYFDEFLGKWTNRLEGGSAVGYAFSAKVEAVIRGGCLAEYLDVRQIVLRGPRDLIGPEHHHVMRVLHLACSGGDG